MVRGPTGQLTTRIRVDGGTSFGCRFRVNGKRRHVTLGSSDEGMTEEGARAAMRELITRVRRGDFSLDETHPEARELIAQELQGAVALGDGERRLIAIRALRRAPAALREAQEVVHWNRLVTDVIRDMRLTEVKAREREIGPDALIILPDGTAKRLRDCTLTDIRGIIGDREERAESLRREADRFRILEEGLAGLAEGATVMDLPEDVLTAFIQAESERRGHGR